MSVRDRESNDSLFANLGGFYIMGEIDCKGLSKESFIETARQIRGDRYVYDECSYIDKYKPYDKAGAYAIQEMGNKYIEKFDGSLSNIIGLPLEKLGEILEKLEIKLKPNWQENIDRQITFS